LSLWSLDAPAPNRRAHDHIGNYNFKIEIGGVDAGHFMAAGGLGIDVQVVEYQNGDDMLLRKRPSKAKYKKITLRKGYINTDELWNWRKKVEVGKAAKKDVEVKIVQRHSNGKLVPRCSYRLLGTKLEAVRKRKAKYKKRVVTYLEADLVPTRVTHNCTKMFKHPSKR